MAEAAGRLGELRSGRSADLASGNLSKAIDILDAASSQVLSARARAGSFEQFAVVSTRNVLTSSIVNVSGVLSRIADTDVAAESARLVQALILVEAGLGSVSLANSRRAGLLDFFR